MNDEDKKNELAQHATSDTALTIPDFSVKNDQHFLSQITTGGLLHENILKKSEQFAGSYLGKKYHNPFIAFWSRAKKYYAELLTKVGSPDFSLRLDDSALIISDLGQSLYMLFGRHWNDEGRTKYKNNQERSDTAHSRFKKTSRNLSTSKWFRFTE